jgi:hypothetical protein
MNSVESFWKSVDGLHESLQGIFLEVLWTVWMDSLLESVWMDFYGKVWDGLDEFCWKVCG